MLNNYKSNFIIDKLLLMKCKTKLPCNIKTALYSQAYKCTQTCFNTSMHISPEEVMCDTQK